MGRKKNVERHLKKMKGRRETNLFQGWGPVGRVGTRKGRMRVNMVDVFCIHV
jgi:hypothetical protein